MKEKPKDRGVRSQQRPAPPISGEELSQFVARAKEGQVEAFQKLYEIYGRKILNYLYRMTGSREEAEDLAQDTFILAYRNLETLKENNKFQSWLFRIAQNNVYQKYRGRRPQIESIEQEEIQEISEAQRLAAPSKSPEGRVLSEELKEVIEKAIDELPEKYREVFVLSAIQKLSYKEISTIVDRSLASVKSDIHRARVEVRNKIKRYLGENYGMSDLF